ncbi:Haloacid Dehalogenase Superfamily Class (subfamily) IIA [Micromonospora pallida]|uniref:Haloacid Dehalogenase Superfamily Class (Subfamily) IIA n=1 Tax=Micromonospora pallida TaxID=145854 RepID=A0A1C6RIU3_9ACTN|nr:Haloacid Dehalogenase Superfamily Class (subfamily) IIA [Micromonospora pallida]
MEPVTPVEPGGRDADRPLVERYRTMLFDLDGVVYRGAVAVDHAAPALADLARRGRDRIFVTNNPARTPSEVAALLDRLGVPASAASVVTSAQVAAAMTAATVPPGSRVLAVGGAAVLAALRQEGLTPVRTAADDPVAVVQGSAPEVDWRQLAEASYAVAWGLPWIATNLDLAVPREGGMAPGNGALVHAVTLATGRVPLVAGKPEPAIFEYACRRGPGPHVMVGDGLATDVEGAHRSGLDSVLVLTGVTGVDDLLDAPPAHRPTHVVTDLRGLFRAPPPIRGSDDGHTCGPWHTRREGNEIVLAGGPGDRADGVRVLCQTVWAARDEGRPAVVGARSRDLLRPRQRESLRR